MTRPARPRQPSAAGEAAAPPLTAWDDLRLVLAVAEAGGLAGAARQLRVDPSTVFRRLGQIERMLGLPLFDRHRTGYTVTAAGAEIVDLAARMAGQIDGLALRLAGRAPDPEGEVRVATSDTLLIHLLTPIFADFRARHPGIRLDVVIGNPALNLSRRDADIAIRTADAPPDTLVGRRVARLAWALYGPAEAGPAAQGWIGLGDDLSGLRSAQPHADGPGTAPVGYRVNSVLALAEAVAAGLGRAHLPCFLAARLPGLKRLAPPDPALAVDLWILTHPDLRTAPRIRTLTAFLAEAIGRQRSRIDGTAADL